MESKDILKDYTIETVLLESFSLICKRTGDAAQGVEIMGNFRQNNIGYIPLLFI